MSCWDACLSFWNAGSRTAPLERVRRSRSSYAPRAAAGRVPQATPTGRPGLPVARVGVSTVDDGRVAWGVGEWCSGGRQGVEPCVCLDGAVLLPVLPRYGLGPAAAAYFIAKIIILVKFVFMMMMMVLLFLLVLLLFG